MSRQPATFAISTANGLAFLFLAALSGCVTTRGVSDAPQTVAFSNGRFSVTYTAEDEEVVPLLAASLEKVLPKLSRWGGLKKNVHVRILSTHQALEDASEKAGYPWLRAWARYDEVLLQSPRTWGLFGASREEMEEVLLHELTHCTMYQQAASSTSWRLREIPFWFREGMASYAAAEGYRRFTLEKLAESLEKFPELNLSAPGALYQNQSAFMYSVAYHSFTFLMQRFGEKKILKILSNMSRGQVFPNAFKRAVGISPDSFLADFNNYVRWHAFEPPAGEPPIRN
jgi:hypothetical protein